MCRFDHVVRHWGGLALLSKPWLSWITPGHDSSNSSLSSQKDSEFRAYNLSPSPVWVRSYPILHDTASRCGKPSATRRHYLECRRLHIVFFSALVANMAHNQSGADLRRPNSFCDDSQLGAHNPCKDFVVSSEPPLDTWTFSPLLQTIPPIFSTERSAAPVDRVDPARQS